MSQKKALAALSRREALLLAAGATMVAAGGIVLTGSRANADAKMIDEALVKLIGDTKPVDGKITLDLPQIAENGNTVPIEVSSDTAVEIMVLAMGNPTPGVANFKFGKLAASRAASTRIRLAGTQDVVAVAKLADGSFVQASNTVKVTIGGCGG